MTEENSRLLNEHIDILSLRDLAPGTIATYSSYMRAFIEWLEALSPSYPLSDIPWAVIRSWQAFLKEVKKLRNCK